MVFVLHRRVWGLATVVAVALFVFPLGAGAGTFPNAAPVTISDCCLPQVASPSPLTATSSAVAGSITKVTATLTGLTHGDTSDLDVLLVSPGGQKGLLMSDTGISASSVNLTFDDTAGSSLPSTVLSSGSFKPTDGAEDCPGVSGDSCPGAPAGAA